MLKPEKKYFNVNLLADKSNLVHSLKPKNGSLKLINDSFPKSCLYLI